MLHKISISNNNADNLTPGKKSIRDSTKNVFSIENKKDYS